MKLSEKSHRKIEQFFSEYLRDEEFKLPKIVFYGGKFTGYFTRFLKIEGITVGKRIFIFPENFWRSPNNNLRLDESLVVHEIAHVLQYRREGFFGFLFKYCRDYWRNLRGLKRYDAFSRSMAYFEISFEREARETERKYREWKL
jgi:hypothetical protein